VTLLTTSVPSFIEIVGAVSEISPGEEEERKKERRYILLLTPGFSTLRPHLSRRWE
jgi:hypothetical protein